MKISYNWLQAIIEFNISPEKLAEILTSIGLEVGEVKRFDFIPQGLVIGKIIARHPHPNADTLQLATVDIGKEKPASIICGAPNVEVGKKVVVALPGTVLSLPNKQYLKIRPSKIRGIVSEGMLCTEREIGIGENHDKLMILQTKQATGSSLEQVWKTPTDFVFDIDITPNRNDATSHWGVARDIAAVLHKNPKAKILTPIIPSDDQSIQIVIKDKKACPRYASVIISGIKIVASPMWLQYRLRAIGVRPINNVVDITNFLMFELGQPMHAFDYNSIKKKKVIVDYPAPNTPFTGLDGVTRKLTGEELMIRDGEGNNLGMAGIIGGEESKITEKTESIFLESAYFKPEKISSTARKHHIQTEASFRFERGTDPASPYATLQKAIHMILKYAGGQVASRLEDQYPTKISPKNIPMTHGFITRMLGQAIPKETTYKILRSLEIGVQHATEEQFTAVVPAYRRDVTSPIDLVEEVLRIYGLDKIKASPSFMQNIQPVEQEIEVRFKREMNLKKLLVGANFQEIITNSIVDNKQNTTEKDKEVSLENPLGSHLNSLRKTLLMGGLSVLKHNLNRKQRVLKLFESGKKYVKQDGKYYEKKHLGIWIAGDHALPHWREKNRPSTLADLQEIVHRLFAQHGIIALDYAPSSWEHYQKGGRLMHQGVVCGHLGMVQDELLQKLEITGTPVFFAEIDLAYLLNFTASFKYKKIPKSPITQRDISFVINTKIPFAKVKNMINKADIRFFKHWQLVDTYTSPALGEGKTSYTIRVYFQHEEKTLQEKWIKKSMDFLIRGLEEKFGANIR
ncbi:MAG: phenylalanine--tRNA ligase subunit beta [Cytophagales bacterium]